MCEIKIFFICMVAHRGMKLHGGLTCMKTKVCSHVQAAELGCYSSPGLITESFLNCQIELSGGHLFNKYCLVHRNEMERMRESVCLFVLSRGASLKIKILSGIVEMNEIDTFMFSETAQLRASENVSYCIKGTVHTKIKNTYFSLTFSAIYPSR